MKTETFCFLFSCRNNATLWEIFPWICVLISRFSITYLSNVQAVIVSVVFMYILQYLSRFFFQ